MGARFDLKRHHDFLMATGAVPLNVLEGVVHDWGAQPTSALNFCAVADGAVGACLGCVRACYP
jgi:hypothetical protein